MTRCPKCGYENLDGVTNCKNCRINIEFAFANLETSKVEPSSQGTRGTLTKRQPMSDQWCDECRKSMDTFVEYEWVAGNELSRTRLGPHVRVTYTNIRPLQVRLCEECFRRGLSRHRRWGFRLLPAAGVLAPAWIYVLTKLDSFLPGDRSNRKLVGIVVALVSIVIFGGTLSLIGGLWGSFTHPRGDATVRAILRPYLDAKLKKCGATCFWTRKDFEKVQREQTSEV